MSSGAELVFIIAFTVGLGCYFIALLCGNAAEWTYGSWHCRLFLALFIQPPADLKCVWANYLRFLSGCGLVISLQGQCCVTRKWLGSSVLARSAGSPPHYFLEGTDEFEVPQALGG